MKTQKITLIILASLITACGSNKTVNFTNDPSLLANDPNAILAYCSAISSPQLNGRIKVYSDPYGQIAIDSVELAFDSSINNALVGSNVIKFYKWYVRPDGTNYVHPAAINVIIKDLQSGQIITGQWPEISQAMVDEWSRAYGLQSTSINQFMAGKSIVISGLEMEYDVLRISVQNDSSQLGMVDTLIPAYAANPAKYAAAHGPILASLHPNNSVASQPWTDDQFQQRTMTYCF